MRVKIFLILDFSELREEGTVMHTHYTKENSFLIHQTRNHDSQINFHLIDFLWKIHSVVTNIACLQFKNFIFIIKM